MSAIGPGDWVECVDDRAPDWGEDAPRLVRGAVYTVTRVFGECVGPDNSVGVALCVREAPLPIGSAWDANRFRPIYRPKAEFIESLMRPAPELEPA